MWFNGTYDKLPIPITIIVLGFLELGICFFIYNEVFCKEWSGEVCFVFLCLIQINTKQIKLIDLIEIINLVGY